MTKSKAQKNPKSRDTDIASPVSVWYEYTVRYQRNVPPRPACRFTRVFVVSFDSRTFHAAKRARGVCVDEGFARRKRARPGHRWRLGEIDRSSFSWAHAVVVFPG